MIADCGHDFENIEFIPDWLGRMVEVCRVCKREAYLRRLRQPPEPYQGKHFDVMLFDDVPTAQQEPQS